MGNLFFGSFEIVPKRLPTDIDETENITAYGVDNLYPQRLLEISRRSPLTRACIETLADFINGDGWQNNADAVLNRFGQTSDEILNLLSLDYATYNGFGLHLNFDGNGQVIEVQYIPFEFIRYGKPDQQGIHSNVVISNNWEEDRKKLPKPEKVTQVFPLFNPRTAQVETIMEGSGQVLYFTGKPNQYPLCSFDAVATSSELEDEIQTFSLSNAVSGFHGTAIIKYPGDLSDETEQANIENKLRQIQGSRGQGMMLVEVDEDFTGEIIEQIPADNKDSLQVNTFNQTRDMIIQNYGVPKPLIGVAPQNTVFTQQQIADSYRFYNIRTNNRRNVLKRNFAAIGGLMGIDFGDIKAQVFATESQEVAQSNPPQETEVETEEIEKDAEMKVVYGT